MEVFWQPGVDFILVFQALGTWLALPMLFFSFLGSEEFFLLVLPVLYWSVNAELGLRVGFMLLFNGVINDILKLAFYGPRPYWLSTQVKAFSGETSFGVPSGHSQISAGIWGMLAAWFRRPWFWAVAISIVVMIGLSRLYLGVHFPHDVLLGWLTGSLVLAGVLRLWKPVSAWLATQSFSRQLLLVFGLSMLLLLAGTLPYLRLQSWTLPATWISNAQAAGVDELPNPITLNGTITTSATLFGLLVGLAWMKTQGGFRAEGTLKQRVLRYALGLIGIALIWYGLGAIFPRGEMLIPYLLRFLRYTLLGLWVSAGAPLLFISLKLSARP
jgi:membrane-associated phospholipid phosphatase